MKQNLTQFRAQRGEDIKISFPDPDQVAQIVVNGQPTAMRSGSIVVTMPNGDEEISKVNVAVDPAHRTGPIEVQIQSRRGVFRHFILPGLELARFRFFHDESELKLVYCSVEDDFVVAGKNGKCPIHGRF